MENKRFNFKEKEPMIIGYWKKEETYKFPSYNSKGNDKQKFIIDTPPAYANGSLHHGHGMSYTHIDIIARYKRMKGFNTLLPLCFDDNGLPTEKFTEKKYKIKPGQHPANFKELCMQEANESIENQTKQLERLGFSYNHKLSYRTIDKTSERITQENFLKLFKKGLIKRSYEPQLFCTDCRTTLSQADITQKKDRAKLFYIHFPTNSSNKNFQTLPIATTRPEFLPACSSIFYNPKDSRYNNLQFEIYNPLNNEKLLFLPDYNIDIDFGSGLMMACTFGNQEDIYYFREHKLPLKEIMTEEGILKNAGILSGKNILEAREITIKILEERGFLIKEESLEHNIPICERCSSSIEIIMSWQWSLDILSSKKQLAELTRREINWYPKFMLKRLLNWNDGLKWNWIISRQRHYGISIPIWYCNSCNQTILPKDEELPINPKNDYKNRKCPFCNSNNIKPETDIFDTWMTSSLTPRILHENYKEYLGEIFTPLELRPQAHEIIRTWAYYTIYKEYIKSEYSQPPWKDIMISGWGLGFQTKGKRNMKASKSSGGGIDPIILCDDYGADAFRYWTALARPGKDQYLNEHHLNRGKRLITKIYNATKILLQMQIRIQNNEFINDNGKIELEKEIKEMKGSLLQLSKSYDNYMEKYNYTEALKLIENSFWDTFCSKFIEFMKKAEKNNSLTKQNIKDCLWMHKGYLLLFAPFLPFITEYLWQIIPIITKERISLSIHLENSNDYFKF